MSAEARPSRVRPALRALLAVAMPAPLLWLRLPLQALVIWLALWVGRDEK